MPDSSGVDVAGMADDVMDALGDDPTKARLDKAWSALDDLVGPLDPSWRLFISDRYETLANLYALLRLEPPRLRP
jgi:hypothetical protein